MKYVFKLDLFLNIGSTMIFLGTVISNPPNMVAMGSRMEPKWSPNATPDPLCERLWNRTANFPVFLSTLGLIWEPVGTILGGFERHLGSPANPVSPVQYFSCAVQRPKGENTSNY